MQCCGTPFKIGDAIDWFVCKWEFEKLIVDVGNADFYYDHHCDNNSNLLKMKGNVTSIVAIHYAYKRESENSNLMIPISGIAVDVKEADGWDGNFEGKELFCYYVCLENVSLSKYDKK